MSTSTYTIPERNMPALYQRVESLNSTCDKLGLPHITVTTLSTRNQEHMVNGLSTGLFVTWHTVQVEGESPVISGWSFVAQLEHTPAGNIVHGMGSPVPDDYRNAPPVCDHCGMTRNRINTYVLINADGQYKQVGSSCLRDFTGHSDPHAIASYLESLYALVHGLEDSDPDNDMSSGGYHTLVNCEGFLSLTAACIAKFGWMGKTKAAELQTVSTCERAIDNMTRSKYIDDRGKVTVEDKDRELAKATIEWARVQDGKSEYEHNLRVVCSGEYTSLKNTGILASAIVAYRKAHAQDSTGNRASNSEHIGQIGDKVTLKVTVTRISETQGNYGLTSIVSMLSGDNMLVWFASGQVALEEGHEYTIKGTVKAHNVYNGRNQTALTRCKVI